MPSVDLASPRWLLVKTCQDVAAKAKSPDLYAKLRIAGLIRHLLDGPHSLLDRVLKDSDERVEFWFREPPEDGAAWTSSNGFDASRREIAEGRIRRETQAAFLEARVAYFEQWFSVGQLLAAVDHFYAGAPPTRLEGVSRPAMIALDAEVRSGRHTIAVAIQEITGVTLRALLPFAERSEPAPKPPSMAPAGSACPFGGKIALE